MANNPFALKYLKALGDNASIVETGTIYDSVNYIDTGCYMLNAQFSSSIYNGLPSNKITAIAGEESTGKTFLLLGFIKHFLKTNKDSFVVFFESEGAVNKDTFEKRGIDSSRVILKPVRSVEEFRHISTNFLKSYMKDDVKERPKIFMCLDSLGMLPSSKEVKDAEDGNDKSDMTRPKIIKSLFRILTVDLASANIPFVFTNHLYATMDMYGAPDMSGGSGLKYASSVIIYLSKSNYKEVDGVQTVSGGEHMGISVTSHTIKSRYTKQKKKIKFVIHVEYGLDRYSSMFDFCYDNELIGKKGMKYYWKSDGVDSQLEFKKDILKSPKSFFIKKRLDELDAFCKKYFGYGDITLDEYEQDQDDIDEQDDSNVMVQNIIPNKKRRQPRLKK